MTVFSKSQTLLAKFAARRLLKQLEKLAYGAVHLTLPDGRSYAFTAPKPGAEAKIVLRDWRAISNAIRKGDIGLAEDFRDGNWECDDLVETITLFVQNEHLLGRFLRGRIWFGVTAVLSYLRRLNTLRGSKKNIRAHYDLGNDFYQLWLDPGMTYSSALFRDDADTLEQAQHNKYDRILERLAKGSGNLLDIGCGWGGFLEHATRQGDFAATGITLSEKQHHYADERLGGKARIALEDYRHQSGAYDHIVSIEMFEAVGQRYWNAYFRQIAALLKRSGRAMIQAITLSEEKFVRYRNGGDFIRSYVFPGGMLPSYTRFCSTARRAGLKVQDTFYFGGDYARTLNLWLKNFDRKYEQVCALGFDKKFIRMWRFYLAICCAGFRTANINVMQIELRHS